MKAKLNVAALRMAAIFSVLAAPSMLASAGVRSPSAAQTLTFPPFTAGGPAFVESHTTLNGHPVTVVRITAFYHQMDLPAGSAQPIGLEYFKYFIKDPIEM